MHNQPSHCKENSIHPSEKRKKKEKNSRESKQLNFGNKTHLVTLTHNATDASPSSHLGSEKDKSPSLPLFGDSLSIVSTTEREFSEVRNVHLSYLHQNHGNHRNPFGLPLDSYHMKLHCIDSSN